MNDLLLLDTTIRDGSYVVNFQFTANDTAIIASSLDRAGVPLIEVGHGLGMSAGKDKLMLAAVSDEEYLRAASTSVKNGKWGMFFIPGIGTMDDIKMAADHGMDFIRIGTNVTDVTQSSPYVEKAKSLGLITFSNLMKTYALAPKHVGQVAKVVENLGFDYVCVVDSAGGMFPDDLVAYFSEIRSSSNMKIGFHGHNNLGLGIANSLKAVDLGAAVVDTSVRGLGRSSGNANTEIFLLALKRKSIDLGIEVKQILDLAEKVIDDYLKNYNQINSIDIISGYAQFHSSFLGLVFKYADKHRVDPRDLIVSVSEHDRVNADSGLIEMLASDLSKKSRENKRISIQLSNTRSNDRENSLMEVSHRAAKKASSIASKFGKKSVFNIVQSYRVKNRSKPSTVIHETDSIVYASAEIASLRDSKSVLKAVLDQVDYICLDSDKKLRISDRIIENVVKETPEEKLIFYSDLDVWSRSVCDLLNLVSSRIPNGPSVKVVGQNELSELSKLKLGILGFTINPGNSSPEFLVLTENLPSIDLGDFSSKLIVVDAIVGGLNSKEIKKLHDGKIPVLRPNMTGFIAAEIKALITLRESLAYGMEAIDYDGFRIAPCGVLAPRGTLIVDKLNDPGKLFGMADGKGFLIENAELREEESKTLHEFECRIASIE
tara:strand:+ start:3743 stop:5719 length:1977 start_codon:yes stop_codon:yes gene_type:complete